MLKPINVALKREPKSIQALNISGLKYILPTEAEAQALADALKAFGGDQLSIAEIEEYYSDTHDNYKGWFVDAQIKAIDASTGVTLSIPIYEFAWLVLIDYGDTKKLAGFYRDDFHFHFSQLSCTENGWEPKCC